MCGIHGIVALRGSIGDASRMLTLMGDVTRHRGPDDFGEYIGDGGYLGQRRLSIIDLAGGHQPLPNEDETVWAVCNGEIYNYRELTTELQALGHRFKTKSDSEVIIHMYEQYGDGFVGRLNGMFAFAIWDGRRKRMLIARDRLGIKPIYHYSDGTKLCFASEAKSILSLPGIDCSIDWTAANEYFALGYVPAPFSIFKKIKKLAPATLMICERGAITERRYWQYQANPDNSLSESDWCNRLVDDLTESVRSQLVSDVPLGAFLSGGIDSSAIVALMARNSDRPIKTYSIGFDSGKAASLYNELPYAKAVAERYKTDHHEILVRPDVVDLLPKLIWHLDEPVADSAFITTYLIAKFARQDVTVILSGVGGDELFGGYRRYLGEYYGAKYNLIPKFLRSGLLAPIAKRLPSDRHSGLLNLIRYARSFILSNELSFEERYRSYVQVFGRAAAKTLLIAPVEVQFDALGQAFAAAKAGKSLDRLFEVDLRTQLPDDLLLLTDKMTMATSLECRVPLLDDRMLDLAQQMPVQYKIKGRTLKYILKQSLRNVLSDDILFRKKRGFGAPMGSWIKQELAPVINSLLSKESVQKRGYLDWETVDRTISLHRSNREDFSDHLQAMVNFELWCRLFLDKTSPEELSEQIKHGIKG